MALQIILNCRGRRPRRPVCVELFGTPGRSSPTIWRFESVRGFGSVGKIYFDLAVRWTRFSVEKPRRLKSPTGAFPRAAFRVLPSISQNRKTTLAVVFLFWLGWMGSNHRNARVKVWCLTAWLHPNMSVLFFAYVF